MTGRSARGIVLGAGALGWTVWCLVSAGTVAVILRGAGALLRRDLAGSMAAAVVVETVLLGLTALVLFRVLARADAPGWFWVVAPGGYAVSYAAYVVLERIGNGAAVVPAPAAALEIAVVCAVAGAGAYLGGLRRPAAMRDVSDAGDGTG